MLNFIVAKALAKNRDDRYQNAKDFATDLRACRDTLPRSHQQLNVAAPSNGDKVMLDAIVVNSLGEAGDPAENTIPPLTLSKAFDSQEATMRLAAMTTAPEVVDELAKTLKIAKPTAQVLKQAAMASSKPVAKPVVAKAVPPRPVVRPAAPRVQVAAPAETADSKRWILLAILLLVLVVAFYLI